MGHPTIDNGTPFVFEPVFIADEDLRPLVVTLVKATYQFDLKGAVWLADEQRPVSFAGEPWTDAPVSSYKYEPEVAFCKLATDVALVGHAHAAGRGTTQLDVGIRVGPVQRLARVSGDRYWIRAGESVRMTPASPFETIALTWENAFGGVDRTKSTAQQTAIEVRNPVGTGFGQPLLRDGDRLRLPNIEDPATLLSDYGAIVTPCGFGFTSPDWQPRARFAGTYDDAWDKSRKPMLPTDFDRRFFSAAAPGLTCAGYLRGDEEVILLNTTPESRVAFRLPSVAPPQVRLALRGVRDAHVTTNLDTVIVNSDERLLILLWRAYYPLVSGPHDVRSIAVGFDN